MAMTKAEKAEVEALRVRCALAWPPPPPKPVDLDVARAGSGTDWLHLWWVNPHARGVGPGVTDGHNHSTTDYTDEQLSKRFSPGSHITMSQRAGGPWYASKADALRALHYAIAVDCAHRLAAVARLVEAESSGEQR